MDAALAFLNGPGLIPQLVIVVVVLAVFYAVFNIYDQVIKLYNKFMNQTVTLVSDTITGTQIIPQYPRSGFPLLYQSENEVHGLEQSFSMWIFVHPDTFDNVTTYDTCGNSSSSGKTNRMKHIFHKGNADAFPLLAPGVFCQSDKNTIRIYTNSVNKWDNYVEVPNIPVGKWFHMVISQKGKFMDVFINGNVIARHQFETVPKINYGGIYMLSNVRTPKDPSTPIPTDDGNFAIDGPIKGMISRVKYFAYAVNYSHIDSLYRESPSNVIRTNTALQLATGQRPPYFWDNWWVTQY